MIQIETDWKPSWVWVGGCPDCGLESSLAGEP
jgi:hypothetical protein